MVSRRLIAAVKLSTMRSYEIAYQAGLHPSTLSKLICGIEKPKPYDHRVVAIGKVLGVPKDACFEKDLDE